MKSRREELQFRAKQKVPWQKSLFCCVKEKTLTCSESVYCDIVIAKVSLLRKIWVFFGVARQL